MTPYEKNISKPIKERYVICPLLIINVLFQPRLAVNSCLFIATLLRAPALKTVKKISGEAMTVANLISQLFLSRSHSYFFF